MENHDEIIKNILKQNLQELLIFKESEKKNIKTSPRVYKINKEEHLNIFKNHLNLIKYKFNLYETKNEKITIFAKTYTKDILDKLIYSIGKVIYFSYKKNFPRIINL